MIVYCIVGFLGKTDLPLKPLNKIKIEEATSAAQLANIRELFREYAASLEISLCFQNFEAELASLPGKYRRPSGRLLVASENDRAIGCVALRQLEDTSCEMKRLYVRPSFRNNGLGRTLALAIIATAREIGYRYMRLDTLTSLQPAIKLYEALGFRQIPAYYDNPSEKVVFMELSLVTATGKSSINLAGSRHDRF